ncbi:MAG: serine hydroxymethyltransferase [Planctomycetes bacterium]|nr:serine hydroxymethyltransferase [Planctomycetota bacterium]NOG54260.1 serine hydroxymethyltransferase [Planctomycetota bacterium]
MLEQHDAEACRILRAEAARQETTIELIASENHVSQRVMHGIGTCLTNKYAEGYPGRRYYGGCRHHDEIEQLARDRAKELFGCKYANVQPHSGAQANMAVYMAFLEPGDTFASLVLKDGGHLSHGMHLNFSGRYFKPVHYPLVYDEAKPDFEHIDYDAMRALCLEHRPKMILCGYSAYPRTIHFEKFRTVADEIGAIMVADIAHIAGLCATGVHPNPFPHAHVVTTTTHKTLRGPRGGLIMTNDLELHKKMNTTVFPGTQGGPLMHAIGAKAIAFGEALKPEYKTYCRQVVSNAQALVSALSEYGYRLCSGGTDNHLMLVDLSARDADLTGKDAEAWLESAGIITNKNGIPKDTRPPMVTSGLRLGTPAVTTRGLREEHMPQIAAWIDRVLGSGGDEGECAAVRGEVREFCEGYPLEH